MADHEITVGVVAPADVNLPLWVALQRGSGNVAESAAIAAPETSAENRHALRACRGLAVCLEAARSDTRGRTGA